MKNNLISIIITNYNKEKFLKKSLHSACSQNFKDYEIILYDDCSSDNSVNIIKKFKKIKVIKNSKRSKKSGPLNQINGIIEAFKKSKGNIVCLMDSDDCFTRNKLTTINEIFKKNGNIDCIFNFPKSNKSQFHYKIKKNSSIWPTIFPTSCISLKRSFFKNYIKNIEVNKFPNLEIDARITIYSHFFLNKYKIIKKKLTLYNYDPDGINSNVKKFSMKWWARRSEAYSYMKIILKKKKHIFKPSLDFYLTKMFNSLTNW